MTEFLSDATESSLPGKSVTNHAAKNPLFLRPSYHQHCPSPVRIPRTGTLKPCHRPSCCVCGPNAAQRKLQRVRLRLQAEGLWNGSSTRRRYHFVTLRLKADNERWLGPDPRQWARLSFDMMSGAGKVLSEVRRVHPPSGWPGVELEYMSVIHFRPKGLRGKCRGEWSPFVSHVHVLLCEHADADGRFQPTGRLRKRIDTCWNIHLCHKLGLAFSTISEDPPGLVYCQPCRGVVDSAAYMLWEHGRPWGRGHWCFPPRARRVSSSRSFLASCPTPTVSKNVTPPTLLAQTAQVLPTEEPIEAALPTEEPVHADLLTEEPIGAGLPTEEVMISTAVRKEPDAPSLPAPDARAASSAARRQKHCWRLPPLSLNHMSKTGSSQLLRADTGSAVGSISLRGLVNRSCSINRSWLSDRGRLSGPGGSLGTRVQLCCPRRKAAGESRLNGEAARNVFKKHEATINHDTKARVKLRTSARLECTKILSHDSLLRFRDGMGTNEFFRCLQGEELIGIRMENATPWRVLDALRLACLDYVVSVEHFGLRSSLFFGKDWWPFHYAYDYDYINTARTLPPGDAGKDALAVRAKIEAARVKTAAYTDYAHAKAQIIQAQGSSKDANGGAYDAVDGTQNVEPVYRRRPFLQVHVCHSGTNLIAAEVDCAAEGWYRSVQATGSYAGTLDSQQVETSLVQYVDSDIYPQFQNMKLVQSGLYSTEHMRQQEIIGANAGNLAQTVMSTNVLNNYAVGALHDEVREMYQGNVYQTGNGYLRPRHLVHLVDAMRQLAGPVEVKEVTQTFGMGGFITTWSPDCVATAMDTSKFPLIEI